jgi:hypothetical protein
VGLGILMACAVGDKAMFVDPAYAFSQCKHTKPGLLFEAAATGTQGCNLAETRCAMVLTLRHTEGAAGRSTAATVPAWHCPHSLADIACGANHQHIHLVCGLGSVIRLCCCCSSCAATGLHTNRASAAAGPCTVLGCLLQEALADRCCLLQ